MQAIIAAAIAFVFTGFLTNWLVQRWQHRNWVNQQRFLGAEKRFEALRVHADDFARLSSKRLSAMYQLAFSLNMSAETLEKRLAVYTDVITDWNVSLNSIYSKTTMYIGWSLTKYIEEEIHLSFVRVGANIEKSIRRKRNDPTHIVNITSIQSDLDLLQGRLTRINRDMLRHVLNQRAATYQGVEVKYIESSIKYLSNWQLFKALFITDVDNFTVVLTSFELEPPARDLN